MPHTRGASKRLRQSAKRRLQNRATKKAIKTQVKTVLDAASGSVDALREQFRLAVKKLDKAAAKRIIHPNMAAQEIAAGQGIAQEDSDPIKLASVSVTLLAGGGQKGLPERSRTLATFGAMPEA